MLYIAKTKNEEALSNSKDINYDFYAYLHREGVVRFCTEDYKKPTKSNFKNEAIHLTNYSLNKHSKDYVFVEEDKITEISDGSKRTMESYWKSLEEMKGGQEIIEKVKIN